MQNQTEIRDSPKYAYDETLDDENAPTIPTQSSKSIRVKYSYAESQRSKSDAAIGPKPAFYKSQEFSLRDTYVAKSPKMQPSSEGNSPSSLRFALSLSRINLTRSVSSVKIDASAAKNDASGAKNEASGTITAEAKQMEKVFEDPSQVKALRELCDKSAMINYFEFYQGLRLVKTLAADTSSELLLELINRKLKRIQSVYLAQDSALRLESISDSAKLDFGNGVTKCKALSVNSEESIDIGFMDLAKREALEILAKSLYSKFTKDGNGKGPGNPIALRGEEQATQMLVKVLDSEYECDRLIEILAKQHCLENYYYYQKQREACEFAAKAVNPTEIETLESILQQLGRDFIVSNSPFELNIPSKVRINFENVMKQPHPTVGVFEPITKEVLNMMLLNTFPSYLKHYK